MTADTAANSACRGVMSRRLLIEVRTLRSTSENLLDHVNRPVGVKLSNAHGEEAIEELILGRGGLEAGQRAEIVVRVVAHAGKRQVDQRAVVGLERRPKIELERSIGSRGHPISAAAEYRPAEALAFEGPARNRKDREYAV